MMTEISRRWANVLNKLLETLSFIAKNSSTCVREFLRSNFHVVALLAWASWKKRRIYPENLTLKVWIYVVSFTRDSKHFQRFFWIEFHQILDTWQPKKSLFFIQSRLHGRRSVTAALRNIELCKSPNLFWKCQFWRILTIF